MNFDLNPTVIINIYFNTGMMEGDAGEYHEWHYYSFSKMCWLGQRVLYFHIDTVQLSRRVTYPRIAWMRILSLILI